MLRVQSLGMVTKRKGYIEKLERLKKKDEMRYLGLNLRLNARLGLEQIFDGRLTGEIETPKSYAEKVRAVDEKEAQKIKLDRKEFMLGRNAVIIRGSLEMLGYGEILVKKGLEKALQQFSIERNWKRKQK